MAQALTAHPLLQILAWYKKILALFSKLTKLCQQKWFFFRLNRPEPGGSATTLRPWREPLASAQCSSRRPVQLITHKHKEKGFAFLASCSTENTTTVESYKKFLYNVVVSLTHSFTSNQSFGHQWGIITKYRSTAQKYFDCWINS